MSCVFGSCHTPMNKPCDSCICVSIFLSICPSLLSVCLSVCLSSCLPICLPACLSVGPSVCLLQAAVVEDECLLSCV